MKITPIHIALAAVGAGILYAATKKKPAALPSSSGTGTVCPPGQIDLGGGVCGPPGGLGGGLSNTCPPGQTLTGVDVDGNPICAPFGIRPPMAAGSMTPAQIHAAATTEAQRIYDTYGPEQQALTIHNMFILARTTAYSLFPKQLWPKSEGDSVPQNLQAVWQAIYSISEKVYGYTPP